MRYHKIGLLCVQIVICISIFLVSPVNAVEKQELVVNHEINSNWPVPPVRERIGGKSIVATREPLYKKAKKIWPDLLYTDTEVKVKALRDSCGC